MDTKTRPLYMLSTRDPPQNKGHMKVTGWKKIFHANGDQKKAGVAILIIRYHARPGRGNVRPFRPEGHRLPGQEREKRLHAGREIASRQLCHYGSPVKQSSARSGV